MLGNRHLHARVLALDDQHGKSGRLRLSVDRGVSRGHVAHRKCSAVTLFTLGGRTACLVARCPNKSSHDAGVDNPHQHCEADHTNGTTAFVALPRAARHIRLG